VNPPSPNATCDVLVAGAGPVGLFLALQLVQRGHSVRLVEARAAQSEHSKALALMPRTMEIFRIVGISAPFENAAYRARGATILGRHHMLGHIPFEFDDTWFDYVAMVPQNVTERILREQFVAAGGRIDYETELSGLLDTPGCVTVRLRTLRGEERVDARFVVGCDGARSTVRHAIGFGFEGGADENTYVLLDVDTVGDAPTSELLICPNAAGPLAIFPITSRRQRLVAMVPRGFEGELTVDLANELIAQRGPANLGATKLHWGSLFRSHHRQAPGMQKGAIFLAGDAAHIHSPFGGQGLNTGLGDAFNLAWKLDYVLAGHGTKNLLPSYSLERQRVARDVIRSTDLLMRVMSTANPVAQALRNYLIGPVTENAAFRQAFLSRLSGLAISYDRSPIVDGTGRRARDESVRTRDRERRLYDVLDGRYLIVYPASAPATFGGAFETFIEHYGGAVGAMCSDEAGAPVVRLVRPDAYLALELAIAGADPTPMLERLAQVLATHVRRVGRAAPP
jgi:2-polyprenyl-6-methoxyphenol hydroxylase-like FAD-dependent oxidoreductase